MKSPDPAPAPKKAPAPKEANATQDLETAQKIHSLANTIHGRLVALHPWLAPFPHSRATAMPEMWPPTPPVGADTMGWTGASPWTG